MRKTSLHPFSSHSPPMLLTQPLPSHLITQLLPLHSPHISSLSPPLTLPSHLITQPLPSHSPHISSLSPPLTLPSHLITQPSPHTPLTSHHSALPSHSPHISSLSPPLTLPSHLITQPLPSHSPHISSLSPSPHTHLTQIVYNVVMSCVLLQIRSFRPCVGVAGGARPGDRGCDPVSDTPPQCY